MPSNFKITQECQQAIVDESVEMDEVIAKEDDLRFLIFNGFSVSQRGKRLIITFSRQLESGHWLDVATIETDKYQSPREVFFGGQKKDDFFGAIKINDKMR